ncbi:MAG: autotransporter-associated beta strand repeat-containing protein [Opitutaceae bacterium]|jgi:fibronectin-binding autotransporter adhesin|nr:autotransporter-associated beta strand repeat-containing protein [Opitutaceae bacterium]
MKTATKLFCLLAPLSLALTSGLRADDGTWTGLGANNNWATQLNWGDGSVAVPGSNQTATFDGAGNGQTTINLSANLTLKAMTFTSASAAAYTIGTAPDTGGTLTWNANGQKLLIDATVLTNQTINSKQTTTGYLNYQNDSTAASLIINGSVNFGNTGASRTVNVTGVGDVTINGIIGDPTGASADIHTVGIQHTSTGTVILANANTFSGTVQVTGGGILAVNSLGNGGVASSVGTSSSDATSIRLVDSTLRYIGAGETSARGFGIGTSGQSAVVLQTATIDASGTGALTLNGQIAFNTNNRSRALILDGTNTGRNSLGGDLATNGSGNVTLTKQGAGTWILAGANSYKGATTVSAGTLLINGNQSAATGAINVASGATLGGTGTAGGVITLDAGAAFAAGDISEDTGATLAGTFTGTSLTWNSNGTTGGLKFDLGANDAASDKLVLSGAFTKGAGDSFLINLSGANASVGTTYTLATFASTDFTLGDFSAVGTGLAGTLALTSTVLTFTVTSIDTPGIPEPSTWTILASIAVLGVAAHFRRR